MITNTIWFQVVRHSQISTIREHEVILKYRCYEIMMSFSFVVILKLRDHSQISSFWRCDVILIHGRYEGAMYRNRLADPTRRLTMLATGY